MSEGNLIDAVCDRIHFDKERLEKNELGRIEVECFNLSEFWTQFGAAVQSLNSEVTKVGFSCGKQPFPSSPEIDSMMQDLLQYYTVMRDLYMVLPPNVGTVLYKAVTSAVVAIVASLLDFVKSLHCLTEKGAKERLTLTGTFWDACNAVDALPKDNLQATLKVMESEVDLASDAQQELETVSTCTDIDEINKKAIRMLEESELRNVNLRLDSKKEQQTVNAISDYVRDHNKELMTLNKTESFRESETDQNPDDIHNELNVLRSDEEHVTDSDAVPLTYESSHSDFVVLDEVFEDDLENIYNSDSVSVLYSPSNVNNVILDKEGLERNESAELIRIPQEISSGTKSNMLKSATVTTPPLLSPKKFEAAFVLHHGKDVFLNDQVPEKRLTGAVKKRRRKYIEELSENLFKAFESDTSLKDMEAMVLNVPNSFIENCDSFSATKVIDIVREHNSTLDTQEWLLHTYWIGEGQLNVLVIVDKPSAQKISALGNRIYMSKDLKIRTRAFIPTTGKKLITTVNCGNRTTTPNVIQGKIKPGKSEFQVNDIKTDTCNPTKLENIFSGNDCCDVSGNGKNEDNLSQLNGKILRGEQCELKRSQCSENTQINGQVKLIILTGTDFKNLEKWITTQLGCGKLPSREVMQSKISEITQLVQKLETNPNDPIFEGMTESQKKEKHTNLNKTLEDFLAMRKIMDTEPEQFKDMLSKANLNSPSKEVSNRISKAESHAQDVLNSEKHRCKTELELVDKSLSDGERLHDIEVTRKCPETLGTNTTPMSSSLQDIAPLRKPPVFNQMEPAQENSKGLAETREWIASQKRSGNRATFSQLMHEINLCNNMIKIRSATWQDQRKYNTSISSYNKKLKRLLLVKQAMEENPSIGLAVEEKNSVPTGVHVQNDFKSAKNDALDQHVNVSKGEEQSRSVPVNCTQIRGPNSYNQSVNISVNLDCSSLSSTSKRCSSEISGNKRKINLETNKGGPFNKNPRTEFRPGNQTNVNVSICSSVGVTSQQVKPGCDIRTGAKLTVSLGDVHEENLSEAGGSRIQVTANSHQNSDIMKTPHSTLDSVAMRASSARMMKHFEEFMKSLETKAQSPSVNDRSVRNPSQLPVGGLPENTNREVNDHVRNVKAVDFVNVNNRFVQVENSDMATTKTGQDVELFMSVQNPVRKTQELIHMFLPTPVAHNCSTAFLYYYPHLQIKEALENIARRNPGLNCTEWTVHREWRDEQQCYNALLWADTDSYRALEAQGLTARVTYRYYAFFKRVSVEAHERLMPNISQPLWINSQHMAGTFTPMLISDYQHGMAYNIPPYHQPGVSITQSFTTQVSSTFTPVQVTDYQHGQSACPSAESPHGSEKSLIYSPTRHTSDTSDEDSSQPTSQISQVTSPGVITDYTDTFY